MRNKTCKCEHCTTHDLYCWAVVINCKCGCHQDGFTSHSAMCCSLPNVLKSENPHTDLESPAYYKAILERIQSEDEQAIFQYIENGIK